MRCGHPLCVVHVFVLSFIYTFAALMINIWQSTDKSFQTSESYLLPPLLFHFLF